MTDLSSEESHLALYYMYLKKTMSVFMQSVFSYESIHDESI